MGEKNKRRVLLLLLPTVGILVLISTMIFLERKANTYREQLIANSYMQELEIDYNGPCKYPWETNTLFDTDDASEAQLETAAQVYYSGESGIRYSFGVEGAKPSVGDKEDATVALNPKAYTTRRVGFYFMPTGSTHITNMGSSLDLLDLQEIDQAAFFKLNEECGEVAAFESNRRPNCSLTFERGTKLIFEGNNWNCFVLSFDLDTHEVLDAFELVIEEFYENGKVIEPILTKLEGWWKLTGTKDYTRPEIEGVDIVGAAINQHNASFSQRRAGDGSDIIDYFGVNSLPLPTDAIVHQVRSEPYATSMLTWSGRYGSLVPTTAASNRMIAVIPKWDLEGSKWEGIGCVPLITLYGYLDVASNGEVKFVYVGYTQFEDSRCFDEVPHYVVAGE